MNMLEPNQHTARKLVDIAQKARGRTPLKYELEVIPFFAGELPAGLEKVAFAWERGSKLFVTDAEAVNPHTRAVFWKQYLKQTATLYKDNGRLLPKEYTFKIQHVRGSRDSSSKKTIGKIKVDMSQFCSEETTSIPQEIFLQLKPAGKLKISVKASWLRDAKVDMDALTEASFTTHRSDEGGAEADREDEQDLSGFDPVHQEPVGQPHQLQHHHSRVLSQDSGAPGSAKAAAGSRSSASKAASTKLALAAASESSSQAPGSPKIQAAGVYHKPGPAVPGPIHKFSVGLSPDEAAEQDKARLAAIRDAELENMRRRVEEQLRSELHDALAKHNQTTWRDYFCCCYPRKAVRVRTNQELATLDEKEGLSLAETGVLVVQYITLHRPLKESGSLLSQQDYRRRRG